jgi:hypothetical protein
VSSRSAPRETGQNQHRQVGRAGLDRGERVDAALVGHREVHDEDVDLALADDVDGFAAVRGLGHDREVDLLGEELRRPARTMAWSSMMAIRIMAAAPGRVRDFLVGQV